MEQDRNGAPMPLPNDGPSMHDLVVQDMLARKAFGQARYGTLLQAHNGRDALNDLYEELMDALVYLRQCMEERDRKQGASDECRQYEANYARLRRHLIDSHGYSADECMDTGTSLVQEHLTAHRILDKDHEYQPWGGDDL